jgi:hypothetical protein
MEEAKQSFLLWGDVIIVPSPFGGGLGWGKKEITGTRQKMPLCQT